MVARAVSVLTLWHSWIVGVVAAWFARRDAEAPSTIQPEEISLPSYPPANVDPVVVAHEVHGQAQSPGTQRLDRIPKKKAERPAHPIWDFRKDILDRLDEYFRCMRTLRKHDPDSYDLFSRVGLCLPSEWVACGDNSDNRLRLTDGPRAAFGGILMPDTREYESDDWVPLSFLYFTKVASASRVQSYQGDIYQMTAMWDDRERSSLACAGSCHIAVGTNGELRLLREATATKRTIYPGRGRKGCRKKDPITMTVTEWVYPAWIWRFFNDPLRADTAKTPEEWVTSFLVSAFNTYRESVSKIIIRAERGGVSASFGIEATRAKYFFKDRDSTAVAADGKRKRIFHCVASHDRVITEGRTTRVRYHYRGIRDFDWNGNSVHVVLPSNAWALEFDKGVTYAEDVPEGDEHLMLTAGQVGDRLVEVLVR